MMNTQIKSFKMKFFYVIHIQRKLKHKILNQQMIEQPSRKTNILKFQLQIEGEFISARDERY